MSDPSPTEALARWHAALADAAFVAPLEAEDVPVVRAAGRVLAGDARAMRPSPPMRVAAMDGIAVRAADIASAPVVLAEGAYAFIDTGAPMPEAFDTVVMHEDITVAEDGAHVGAASEVGKHVRPVGEDIPTDVPLLVAGHVLGPFDVALLTAAGVVDVAVRRRVSVAVIPTGDELRSPGEALEPHHVIDSNCPMLAAQAMGDGADAHVHARVVDDPDALAAEVMRAVLANDVVLLVAGSSKGRRDHAGAVLGTLGTVAVDGVAVRPAHPVILAVVGSTPVVGVPGYPVSAAVTYELFVRPMLGALAGGLPTRREVVVRLAEDVGGKADATCVVAVRLEDVVGDHVLAYPQARRAGALRALAGADAYIVVPPGDGLAQGSIVVATRFRN